MKQLIKTLGLVAILPACSFAVELAATPSQAKAQEPLAEQRIPEADHLLTYKTVNGQALSLYFLQPKGWRPSDKRPAYVYFHGGGWIKGDPVHGMEWARMMQEQGMVALLIQYRLTIEGKNLDPACCIEDAKSAIRYVRAHAGELGVDPDRIAAAGHSAGGHLSAACALLPGFDSPTDILELSAKPNALVLMVPVLDNGPEQGYMKHAPVIKANLTAYSPAHNVKPGAPPTIIFGGTQDSASVVSRLQKFTERMKEAGNACSLHVYEGGHDVTTKEPVKEQVKTEILKFFEGLNWLPL